MHPIQAAIDLLLEVRKDLEDAQRDGELEQIDTVVKELRLELAVSEATKSHSEWGKIAAVSVGAAALAASLALMV